MLYLNLYQNKPTIHIAQLQRSNVITTKRARLTINQIFGDDIY